MVRPILQVVSCCLLLLTTRALGGEEAHGENSVAFAPDSTWLVTGGSDGKVRVRDGVTGAVRDTLSGHRSAVNAVAVSPDGRTIASASNDCSVRLWDVERRLERSVLEIPRPPRIPGQPRAKLRSCFLAVAFAPDGRTVATGDNGGRIQLWDAASGELRESWDADPERVTQVNYAPDGATIASGGKGPDVRLWDARSHTLRRSLPQPGRFEFHLAFAPDGATLAASRDEDIRLWDLRTGAETTRFQVGVVVQLSPALAFTPDGAFLAAGGIDITYLCSTRPLVDEAERSVVLNSTTDVTDCTALAVSPDGRWVAHCFGMAGDKAPKVNFQLVAIR